MVRMLVVALVVATLVWAATEGRRRWLIHQLRVVADRHGYTAEPGRRPLPRRFDIRGSAHGSVADLVLIEPRTGSMAFRHRYWSGRSGGQRQTHEHLHVLVPLPFNAPHVVLRRPTVANRLGHKLGLGDTEIADHDLTRRFGLVDVEVGNEIFDRAFQVSTDDERFVRRLAGGQTGVELARRNEFNGMALRFEFFGPWLLVSGPDHTVEDAALLLDWMQRLPVLFPGDLPESYPAPADRVDPWG
ncbi:MAG: hypothetical protein AAGG08_03990 [Actinomycetota bacterium]